MSDVITRQSAMVEVVGGEQLTVLEDAVVLEMDVDWAPFVQGSVTVATPATPIDPREGVQLHLTLLSQFGAELQFTSDLSTLFGGGTTADISDAWGGLLTSHVSSLPGRSWNATPIPSTSLEAHVWVRSAREDGDGRLVLGFASAEALTQDVRIPAGGPGSPLLIGDTFRELYTYLTGLLVSIYNSDYTLTLEPGTADADIPVGLDADSPTERYVPMTAGKTLWDFLSTFTDVGNLRLWGDLDGKLYLVDRDATTPGTVVLSGAERVTEAPSTIDLDQDLYGDSIIIEWEPNPTDAGMMTVLTYMPVGWKKPIYVKRDGMSPLNQFNDIELRAAVAAPMLERALRRGREIPVTALNDFTTRPGMEAIITAAHLPEELTGRITAVRFDLATGLMQVRTHNLEEAP